MKVKLFKIILFILSLVIFRNAGFGQNNSSSNLKNSSIKNNAVYINLTPLFLSALSLNYQVINFNKHLAVSFSSFISLHDFEKTDPRIKTGTFDYAPENTIWNFGVSFNYIDEIKRKSKTSLPSLPISMIGPSIEYGTFHYGYIQRDTHNQVNKIGQKSTVLFWLGGCNKLHRRFFISESFAFGRIFFDRNYKHPDKTPYIGGGSIIFFDLPKQREFADKWTMRIALNIGYRF